MGVVFGNPIVGGVTLVRPAIRSPNFVTGLTGWSVNIDGSAEFNNVTIRGAVTIGGTSLYYSTPTPQAHTLVASVSATAFTDSAGNSVVAGHATYHYTAAGGFSLAVATTDLGVIWYSATAGTLGPWTQIQSIVSNPLLGNLALSNATVAGQLTATGGTAGSPSLITTDTWHAITLDSGWAVGTITPSYRLTPNGDLQLKGQANRSGIAGSANVNNNNPLPVGYRPPGTVDYYAYDPSFNRAHMSINAGGVITASAVGTVTGTWVAEMNKTITLT